MRHALVTLTSVCLALGCAAGGGEADGADGGPPGGVGGGVGPGPMGGGGSPPGFGGGSSPDPGPGPSDNVRPELKRIGDREFPAAVQGEIQLEAMDPDGDILYFNVRSALPDGSKFTKETGKFTWTPEMSQVGEVVLITFEVSDGALKDQETIVITVVGAGQVANKPPEIDEIGDQAVTAGQPFTLQVVASDPNGDEITYRLEGPELPGASLDATSGLFAWTPDRGLVGQSFGAEIVASDGQAEARESVTFVVRDEAAVNQNLPPDIVALEDRQARVGEEVRFEVVANDDNPASLVISLVGQAPAGATFDPTARIFAWTPTPEQGGSSFRVVFQVTDGEFRDIERLQIHVEAAEMPGGECTPDVDEAVVTAVPLPHNSSIGIRSICPAHDIDEYAFELAAGNQFVVLVQFVHTVGDLDLAVVGPNNFMRTSATSDDDETVRAVAPTAGSYVARVSGWNQTVNPEYSITLEVQAQVDCNDDAFDTAGAGNDTAASAADLRAAQGQMLTICPDDSDYYAVELQAGAAFTVHARFTHAMGDIDLVMVGPGDFSAGSLSTNDDETIAIASVPSTGRYLLAVSGFSGASNTYRLEIVEMAAPMCEADRLEANNTLQASEPIPPELYHDLTWCDDDWYKTEVSAGDTLNIFLSYDGDMAPTLTAFDLMGELIEGQTVSVATGDGCEPIRDGCRRLTVRSPAAGWVHYSVTDALFGSEYDLRVRKIDAGSCDGVSVECGDDEVCDYERQSCIDVFCIDEFDCPNGYVCHQEWCVEPCAADGSCRRVDHACKVLDGQALCGLVLAAGSTGGACFDFSDCRDRLDCHTNEPGGYCSASCDSHMTCGEGAVCSQNPNGNFCGQLCGDDRPACRQGYDCVERQLFNAPATERICEPSL